MSGGKVTVGWGMVYVGSGSMVTVGRIVTFVVDVMVDVGRVIDGLVTVG